MPISYHLIWRENSARFCMRLLQSFQNSKPSLLKSRRRLTDGLWGPQLHDGCIKMKNKAVNFSAENSFEKYENFLPRSYTERLFIHNFMQVIGTTQMISFSCKMMTTTTFHSQSKSIIRKSPNWRPFQRPSNVRSQMRGFLQFVLMNGQPSVDRFHACNYDIICRIVEKRTRVVEVCTQKQICFIFTNFPRKEL